MTRRRKQSQQARKKESTRLISTLDCMNQLLIPVPVFNIVSAEANSNSPVHPALLRSFQLELFFSERSYLFDVLHNARTERPFAQIVDGSDTGRSKCIISRTENIGLLDGSGCIAVQVVQRLSEQCDGVVNQCLTCLLSTSIELMIN